jgi:pimeloyl-ACP methyl ester carboxylesterase
MLDFMGERVRIGRSDIWYEVAGDGDPVVLLHGGLSDGTGWTLQLATFAERYRVFVPDRRGHGKSPDTDAPFHYDDMADETIGFLDQVVRGPAHLVGWSDGGIVALLVSMRRPDLVRRQVLIGANFHHEGLLPEFDTGDDPDGESVAVLKAIYEGVAVDPAHWPEFYAKTMRLFREEPELSVEDLAKVTAPSLVLVGDDDCIHHEHTVGLFEALPDAQLAIVPGTSHMLHLEKPDLVNGLMLDFLAETSPPVTLYPMRRA